MNAATTSYSVDEMTATEIQTAQAVIGACRETLKDAARACAAATGADIVTVTQSSAFKALALDLLETAASTFGTGHGCRPDALRAAFCAAMSDAI